MHLFPFSFISPYLIMKCSPNTDFVSLLFQYNFEILCTKEISTYILCLIQDICYYMSISYQN